MKFRSVLLTAVLSIATFAMLLRVAYSVNLPGNQQYVTPATVQFADGAPFPPLPPRASGWGLVADGAPFPPLPPGERSLLADGAPFPPLPPGNDQQLVADGAPFPPLPPGLSLGSSAVA